MDMVVMMLVVVDWIGAGTLDEDKDKRWTSDVPDQINSREAWTDGLPVTTSSTSCRPTHRGKGNRVRIPEVYYTWKKGGFKQLRGRINIESDGGLSHI